MSSRNLWCVPSPSVRTNILDIDFEIIDPDDDIATVGILVTVAEESQNQMTGGIPKNSTSGIQRSYQTDYPFLSYRWH